MYTNQSLCSCPSRNMYLLLGHLPPNLLPVATVITACFTSPSRKCIDILTKAQRKDARTFFLHWSRHFPTSNFSKNSNAPHNMAQGPTRLARAARKGGRSNQKQTSRMKKGGKSDSSYYPFCFNLIPVSSHSHLVTYWRPYSSSTCSVRSPDSQAQKAEPGSCSQQAQGELSCARCLSHAFHSHKFCSCR